MCWRNFHSSPTLQFIDSSLNFHRLSRTPNWTRKLSSDFFGDLLLTLKLHIIYRRCLRLCRYLGYPAQVWSYFHVTGICSHLVPFGSILLSLRVCLFPQICTTCGQKLSIEWRFQMFHIPPWPPISRSAESISRTTQKESLALQAISGTCRQHEMVSEFLGWQCDIDAWRSNLKRSHGFRLRRPRSEVASPKPVEASPMQRRGRALLQLWIMSDCKVLGYQLQLHRRMSSNAISPQSRKMYISIAARVLLRKMWQWCPILQRSKLWQQINSFKYLHFNFGFIPWM